MPRFVADLKLWFFVYLVAVIDVASRKVLAHKVANSLEACHAVQVIEQAFKGYGVRSIVNTNQGSQFTAAQFTQAALTRGCHLCMDGRGSLEGQRVHGEGVAHAQV